MNFDQPIKKEEIKNSQEFKEKRNILEIKIGENNYSIETESYDFEYPKNIQEETGILGYERVIIPKEYIGDIPIEDLLLNLSDGEYPNNTLNHKLGAYTSKKERERMYKDFKQDKFFLQKIFDIDTIKRKYDRNDIPRHQIFNHDTSGQSDFARNSYTLYEKGTNKIIKDKEFIGNIVDDREKIDSGKAYAVTMQGESGLNLISGGVFQEFDEHDIVFGFSAIGKDGYFSDYINKALFEIIALNDSVVLKNGNLYTNGRLNEVLRSAVDIFLMDEYGRRYGDNPFSSADPNSGLLEILKSIAIKLKLEKKDIQELSTYLDHPNTGTIKGIVGEIQLPIFIGHDEIPQLSWGHARYSHYFNNKGLNFFKFKHTEHLPKKF